MKLPAPHHVSRPRNQGFLVVALLAIITIMMIYIAANLHVLAALKRDVRLVEQKQVQRLRAADPVATAPVTNAVPALP